jgi:hypothetical protein
MYTTPDMLLVPAGHQHTTNNVRTQKPCVPDGLVLNAGSRYEHQSKVGLQA